MGVLRQDPSDESPSSRRESSLKMPSQRELSNDVPGLGLQIVICNGVSMGDPVAVATALRATALEKRGGLLTKTKRRIAFLPGGVLTMAAIPWGTWWADWGSSGNPSEVLLEARSKRPKPDTNQHSRTTQPTFESRREQQ